MEFLPDMKFTWLKLIISKLKNLSPFKITTVRRVQLIYFSLQVWLSYFLSFIPFGSYLSSILFSKDKEANFFISIVAVLVHALHTYRLSYNSGSLVANPIQDYFSCLQDNHTSYAQFLHLFASRYLVVSYPFVMLHIFSHPVVKRIAQRFIPERYQKKLSDGTIFVKYFMTQCSDSVKQNFRDAKQAYRDTRDCETSLPDQTNHLSDASDSIVCSISMVSELQDPVDHFVDVGSPTSTSVGQLFDDQFSERPTDPSPKDSKSDGQQSSSSTEATLTDC